MTDRERDSGELILDSVRFDELLARCSMSDTDRASLIRHVGDLCFIIRKRGTRIADLAQALAGAIDYADAICWSEGMKPDQQATRLTCDVFKADRITLERIAVFDVKAARALVGCGPIEAKAD